MFKCYGVVMYMHVRLNQNTLDNYLSNWSMPSYPKALLASANGLFILLVA